MSYGVQGQARYTHVPSILEMVGIPYVASGPLAHSLCLDKVVTKMILRQNSLPTPDFAVLQTPDDDVPDLRYPLIVKPKNEAVSFGLKVVQNETELREATKVIYDEFRQAVLAEQFIEGREVNVGLLGNDPPEAFPPVELNFGSDGPAIYTYEDKTGRSGRSISHTCPAPIGDALLEEAKDLAIRAFVALGCYDCARVDMRLDADGKLYILEINSLPSLGEHGSYLVGADHVGLDFTKFINRLVEVASARYFGTPNPPSLSAAKAEPSDHVFGYITERRDRMERRLGEWVKIQSRSADPLGLQQAMKEVHELFDDLGMKQVAELSDSDVVTTWQTAKGARRRHPVHRQPGCAYRATVPVPNVSPGPGMAVWGRRRVVARAAGHARVRAAGATQHAAPPASTVGRRLLRRRRGSMRVAAPNTSELRPPARRRSSCCDRVSIPTEW